MEDVAELLLLAESTLAHQMPAGSTIQSHSDGCNFHLTCHLGVDVPEGECWLAVGNERREWRNGKVTSVPGVVLKSCVVGVVRNIGPSCLSDRKPPRTLGCSLTLTFAAGPAVLLPNP